VTIVLKKLAIAIAGTALALILILSMLGVLPFFTLTQPSGVITVKDDYGNLVPGAKVEGIATEETFHYLGDVYSKTTMSKGMDYVIDDYDVNYTSGRFGVVDITWADMNGDGKVDIKDVSYVSSNVGLTLDGTKVSNVTDVNGKCTLQIYPTIHPQYPSRYVVTVSKQYYHTRTVTLNMITGGTIIIEKDVPPVAVIRYSPTNPTVGQEVTFDGSGSYDTDGSIVLYWWEIRDGVDIRYMEGVSVKYTFKHIGDNLVILTVTDDLGVSSSSSVEIFVSGLACVAKIKAEPTDGLTPLTVKFDGSESYSPNGGSIVSYRWDFGDGYAGYGAIVTHTYTLPSGVSSMTYTATLTVTDEYGMTGSAKIDISVYRESGYASFTYYPINPYVDEQITFDASASMPSSGATITKYCWTFDGVFVETTTPTTSYSFSSEGDHTVTLYIVDSSGFVSSTTSKTVSVAVYPVADFEYVGELIPQSPITFSFTGQGNIVSYTWDFGDGSTGTGITVTHSYDSSGTYIVRLTVSDGRTAVSTSKTITIGLEPCNVDVLTPLNFPPNTEVHVKVLVTGTQTNNVMANVMVTMQILDSSGTVLRVSSQKTGSDGVAIIPITTPSKTGEYNATFAVGERFVKWQKLYVLPKLIIYPTEYRSLQMYIPGDYDLNLRAEIRDSDNNVVTGFNIQKISLVDVSSGKNVDLAYINVRIETYTIMLQARMYDWYKAQDPTFQYSERQVRIEIVVAKTSHITGVFSDVVKMIPPYLRVTMPTTLLVGHSGITIAVRDPYGNVPEGITLDNIEVIIQTPSGATYSTRHELYDKCVMIRGDISIAFPFNEPGEYKIIIKYYNLPWSQPTETRSVYVRSEEPSYTVLTNPYVLGAIAFFIILIIATRRRKE